MCIEDIRLSRKTIVYRYRYTIPANGSIQVLQNRPNRIALLIPNHGSAQTLGCDTVDMGSTIEGTVNLAYNNLRLSLTSDGNLTTFPWYIMNSSASTQIMNVYETVLVEE